MKKTYNYIFAALVAALALVACTKDIVPGKVDTDSTDVTYRTITVSFDTPTKAKLEGTKPEFEKGDVIMLSDGTNMEPCTVDVVDGVAKITPTVVTGNNLSAVYPSKAVTATKPTDIFNNLLIPAEQSGKFSDANICTATGTADNLCFKNYCPILRFYVDESIKVKKLVIVSQDSEIAGTSHKITLDANKIDVNAKYLNHVSGERVCYVAVNSKINASNLKFISTTDSQEDVERVSPRNIELLSGTIYNAFIPYSVKVGDQKWGYCNVGAFYPEDPGYYFAWGETTGYRFDFPNNVYVPQHSFDWENYSFIYSYNKDVNPPTMTFNEYVSDSKYAVDGNPDKKTTLDLEDDAASQSWGGNWRMPTFSEFSKLTATDLKCSGTLEKYILFDDYGLILSFTGYGYDNTVTNYTTDACYWSSSISKAGDNQASILHGKISDSIIKISTEEHERRMGFPIRPIYDDSMSGDDEKAAKVTIDNYSDGGIL